MPRPSLRRWAAALAVWALAALLPAAAAAEIRLQKIRWQLRPPGAAQKFSDVESFKLSGAQMAGRVRARLTLDNRGPASVEGVLLKYSLTARLVPAEGNQEGIWAVPFLLDEKRVPKIGPNQTLEVSLVPAELVALYLRKIHRAGFYPKEIRLQVMVEPHRGERIPIRTLESIVSLVQ